MKPLSILLAGEGANELGSYAHARPYHSDTQPGVVPALMKQVRQDGWAVANARLWKGIRKFKSGAYRQAETRNVLGLALDAAEMGCDVVAFSRDADGDTDRIQAVEAGIAEAMRAFPHVRMAGATAIPSLEGWMLAIAGVAKTEQMTGHKVLGLLGGHFPAKNTEAMVAHVQQHGLSKVPQDAKSLSIWRDRTRVALQVEDHQGDSKG